MALQGLAPAGWHGQRQQGGSAWPPALAASSWCVLDASLAAFAAFCGHMVYQGSEIWIDVYIFFSWAPFLKALMGQCSVVVPVFPELIPTILEKGWFLFSCELCCRHFTRVSLYLLLKSSHRWLTQHSAGKPLRGMHQSAGVLLEICRVAATEFVRWGGLLLTKRTNNCMIRSYILH